MNSAPQFPFPARPGVQLDAEHLAQFRDEALVPVTLAGGHEALLVTRHADIRTVLSDARFSREAWGNGTLFARDNSTLALSTADPPTHTRRRRAVQGRFTHRQGQHDRAKIDAVAAELLGDLIAMGPPADLVSTFTTPFPYRIICDQLGLPISDLDILLPWVSLMMSAGRFAADEVSRAKEGMQAYFVEQVAIRQKAISAGSPGTDLLTELLLAPADERLTEAEVTTFGLGLLIAGGETTSNHLALCMYEILSRPGLAESLRHAPERIPATVEELLRWVWFAGTGGQIHVVTDDVELGGRLLHKGQVVIPLTDAGNRDIDVFDDADVFRPERDPNPHLGLGHGRHMCLGAAQARVELQVGIETILRLDGLELAVSSAELAWRDQMFIRGVWSLPVRWSIP